MSKFKSATLAQIKLINELKDEITFLDPNWMTRWNISAVTFGAVFRSSEDASKMIEKLLNIKSQLKK